MAALIANQTASLIARGCGGEQLDRTHGARGNRSQPGARTGLAKTAYGILAVPCGRNRAGNGPFVATDLYRIGQRQIARLRQRVHR